MQLFYNPHLNKATQSVKFDKQESGHIVKVLRKINSDKLHITNGKGFLFEAIITDANPNRCIAKIHTHTFQEPLPYRLHMVVAPTKRNERFEWFLEKATEIGVTQITPIICAHSERKTLKLNRFERVIQSAMKQSLQCYLPQLNAPITFQQFIKLPISNQKFIAHCEETQKKALKELITPQQEVTLLIGPEGDFSPEEIETALSQNFAPVSLGNHRLRTETAAIAACHTVALCNQ